MQDTFTTFVVLTGDGLLAMVILKLTTLEWLSSWAAVGTMALTFLVGHYDVAIGDVVVRVIAPECVGWNAYANHVSRLGARYDLVLPRTNLASTTVADARVLATEVRAMSSEVKRLRPPAAADRSHDNVLAVFAETETQLQQYVAGQAFDRTTLNELLDQHSRLTGTANRACR